MKTYEEMTKEVFLARDEHEKKKKKQKKLALRICAAALVLSVGVGAVFTAVKSKNDPVLPSNGEETKPAKPQTNFSFVKAAEPMKAVIYPNAVGFGDYDKMREKREKYSVSDEFFGTVKSFSYTTASEILKGGSKNQNYSPLSLYYALSVCAAGASGETREELLKLLGATDSSISAEQCEKLYNLIYTDNKIGELRLNNSLWLQNGSDFKDEFLNVAAKSFYCEAFDSDFSSEKTSKQIAKWISNNTNGTLSPEISVSPKTLMNIVNTVYFYDEWNDRFQKSDNISGDFYAKDGTVKAEYMRSTKTSAVYFGENFVRAGRSFKNGGRMEFVLPDEGVSVEELLKSPDALKEALAGGTEKSGVITHWRLPKFSFGASYNGLSDTLKKLGINKAFSEADADFSNMYGGEEKLYINGIIQQTHIAVDEKGVEASAYTRIDLAGDAEPKEEIDFFLTRPFIYAIYAQNADVPLFIGVVYNPSAQ